MGDSADNDASSSSCMFCQGTDKFYAVVIGGSLGFIFLLCLLYVLLRRRKRKNESKSKFELEQPIESNYKPMLAISSIHTQNPIYEADGLIQVSTFGKATPIYEADGLFQVSTFDSNEAAYLDVSSSGMPKPDPVHTPLAAIVAVACGSIA